jgi:phosphoglycolate phosphatase
MPTMQRSHLIFDLDGTLIDSAPSILSCFDKILRDAGIAPRVQLNEDLIGPPLPQTLQTLTGIRDDIVLAAMVESFKRCYDTKGYRESQPYAGIAEALTRLQTAGYRLALATNKRILEHLEWDTLFTSVWSLDSFQPRLPDKTAMLREILKFHGIAGAQTVYVGDKAEDGRAAQDNGMQFIAAHWGYGDFADTPEQWLHLDAPGGLVAIIERLKE